MTTHGFTKQGAKRIVDAVRTVEANDPLYAGPKQRRQRPGAGPEAFVVGRVTEVDSADPTLLSVQEQYWSEDDAAMIDLPAGRLWDGGDGNPAKVRAVDGQPRGIDDVVVLGFRHGDDGNGVWFVVPDNKGFFHAKVTASGSSDADHTLAELDANGDVLAGGRTPTDAEALNGRKGVPVDTKVIVFDLGPLTADGDPVYKFLIPDGLTDSPKQLLDVDLTADTTDWDIEVDGSAVQYDTGRVFFDASAVSLGHFWREFIVDASGMLTNVSGEERWLLVADTDDGSYDGALTMVAEGVDGTKIKHNAAQAAVVDTLTFAGTSNEITVSCPQGTDADFDAGGHYNDLTKTITIGLANGPGEPGGGLPSGCSADDILKWNGTAWVCLTPTTTTVVTDWRYDTSTHKFQKKTQSITVLAKGAESGWTNTSDGQPVSQDIVDDVTYDTSTGNLEQDKRTAAYILESGTNSDNNLIEQAEDC